MMLKRILVLLVFPFLIGSCADQRLSSTQKAVEARFQAVLDSIYLANPTAVGIMAHVEAPQRNISWSGAAGYANKETKKSIKADQPAWIASNTKTYVSAAILRLVEQKKLRLDQGIGELLTPKTKALFEQDAYNLEEITVVHLLSHTSGIFDYVSADRFFAQLETDPMYHWTKEEQLQLSITAGEPLGAAGDLFQYADANYLLLTEIIEVSTGKKFYTAMRELLDYDKNKLSSTWFTSLEPEPKKIKSRVHQYFGEMKLDNYKMDPSFDLYGGGGIVATTKDLARFSQLLFEGELFEEATTLDLIYTKIPLKSKQETGYYLGLSKDEVNGNVSYGHGGFWGTVVQYVPELDASIAVFILERDKRQLRKDVLDALGREM